MDYKTKNILIVDDDKSNQQNLRNILKNSNYNVQCVSECQEGIDFCISNIVDLIITELNLPDKDGMVLIDNVRVFNDEIPIIVLTKRDSTENKVIAFGVGANDFVSKPFIAAELLARVKKEFRIKRIEKNSTFVNGHFKIDYDAKSVYINNKLIHLTNIEYKILALLSENVNKTLTTDQIITRTWGENGQDRNGLRVFIAGIRKKIEKKSERNKLIKTVINVGYSMIKI
ncbi:MAG TPA: response regulator transcription factor [Candidatus Onthovivens sp.]|nr:response regulator transcription factor [Candidatus Onthovivens sp.]